MELSDGEGGTMIVGPCLGFHALVLKERRWLTDPDGVLTLWKTGAEWSNPSMFAARGVLIVPVHEEQEPTS